MARNKFLKKIISLGVSCMLAFSPIISGNVAAEAKKFNMSYIYFGDSSSYISRIDYSRNSLDEISPNYFDINDDGTLKLTDAVDINFVNEMHERGIRVVPFLSNHWDRQKGINALNNRKQLAREIVDAVKEYSLDGVNIDIENVTEAERDYYTDFVRLLRAELAADKVISVAVAANPYRLSNGWQASYDYKRLSKYSDYIMVMAYDEHYQGGPAGPVASLSFVERSIKYALETVPKEKIVLGIPFYGRYWKNGEKYGGYGISSVDVEKLIKEYNGSVIFDKASQSPKAVITIKSGDKKPYVLGKKLEAGTYTIWYENEESIKNKLRLVKEYDLKGTGSWSLGQEPEGTWGYYSMWLNGYYFVDAEDHWAQRYILSMVDREWMKGISDSRFAPNNSLTRAEAVVILVRALGLKEKEGGEADFNDISGHWAENEIKIASQHKIVLGQGNGMFSPDDPVTRQEIAVMLDRILTQLKPADSTHNPYKDINSEDFPWSYNSIIKLTNYRIFTGRPDGSFHPLNKTTRAEMAALMDRAATYIEQEKPDKFMEADA